MERKKLAPVPLRIEEDPNYEPEIWQPSWNCFCCQDTGMVSQHIAQMYIEGYEQGKHKFPVCQNPGCQAGEEFSSTDSPAFQNSLDWRLEPRMCQEADLAQRKEWREWAFQRQKNREEIKIDLSNVGTSIAPRERTPEEEYEIRRRHEEERSR